MPRRTTPDPFAARVGARIKELRTERGMSLGDLADAAALSKGHLSSVEHGLVGVTIGTIAALARGFGMPAFSVLTFAEEDPIAETVELIRKLPDKEFKVLARELKKEAKAAKKTAATKTAK